MPTDSASGLAGQQEQAFVDAIRAALDADLDPNDLSSLFESTVTEHGAWGLWGDETWRREFVCSVCGSPYTAICGHQDNPDRQIVTRKEYEAA